MTDTIDTVMGMIESQCNHVSVLSRVHSCSYDTGVAYGVLAGMWSVYLTLTDNNPNEELKEQYRHAVVRYIDRVKG